MKPVSMLLMVLITALHSLIRLKSKGSLIHPSDDVINICLCCEKKFRELVAIGSKGHAKDMQKILISVLDYFTFKDIFSKSCKHMYETEAVIILFYLLRQWQTNTCRSDIFMLLSSSHQDY